MEATSPVLAPTPMPGLLESVGEKSSSGRCSSRRAIGQRALRRAGAKQLRTEWEVKGRLAFPSGLGEPLHLPKGYLLLVSCVHMPFYMFSSLEKVE